MVRSQRQPVAQTFVQNSIDLPDCPLDGSVFRYRIAPCKDRTVTQTWEATKSHPKVWSEHSKGNLHHTSGTRLPTVGTLRSFWSHYCVTRPAQRLQQCCVNSEGRERQQSVKTKQATIFFSAFPAAVITRNPRESFFPFVCFCHPLPNYFFIPALFFSCLLKDQVLYKHCVHYYSHFWELHSCSFCYNCSVLSWHVLCSHT